MENSNLIERVNNYNNKQTSIICCIEEMSELTKVLTKDLRYSSKFSKEKLTEELSHVLLMCDVIKDLYEINDNNIYSEQLNAVERMEVN